MGIDHTSTGDTQILSIEEHHGFVDSCITLIENLLDARSIAVVKPGDRRKADPRLATP